MIDGEPQAVDDGDVISPPVELDKFVQESNEDNEERRS